MPIALLISINIISNGIMLLVPSYLADPVSSLVIMLGLVLYAAMLAWAGFRSSMMRGPWNVRQWAP